jgi:hypothetical protein
MYNNLATYEALYALVCKYSKGAQTFLSQKKEYEREIKHLRHLIQDKEGLMHNISGEKK